MHSCVANLFPAVKWHWRNLATREFLLACCVWLLLIYKHVPRSCWKIFILAVQATELTAFYPLKSLLMGDYSQRMRYALQVNLTLFVAWNLHCSIKTWCNKYILEEWRYQQNAPEDNKILGCRRAWVWDDGSVTCKADTINFSYQHHGENSSPSLTSLVPSNEMAGPPAHQAV